MRSRKLLCALRAVCLCAAAFLTIAASVRAASPRWVQASPFGGWILDLAQAPSAPRMLYAAAQSGVVFRSLDGGATWHRRGKGFPSSAIARIIVDPHDASTVFAITYDDDHALFRTRDGGLTWSKIAPRSFVELAADRRHPGVLFGGTWDGLLRSDDGGDSWRTIAAEGALVSGIAIDPRAPDTIFAVVQKASTTVWKSTDLGATWTQSPDLFDDAPARVSPFVFDPARPEILYLHFHEYYAPGPVLRSTDGGASWSLLSVEGLRDLAAVPDGTLYAATVYGLMQSTDGGATWVPPGPPTDTLTRLLTSSAAPGELFAAGVSGVWRSGDNGASWAASNQGILAQGAYSVAASPTGPPDVFALAGADLAGTGLVGINLFSSADQGATWTRLHSTLEGRQPYAIEAFDPSHPQTIYGIDGDSQAAYPVVSTDGGREWSKLHIPFHNDSGSSIGEVNLTMVTLDHQQEPASILVGGWFWLQYRGYGDFLLRSPDGGRTWKRLNPVRGIGELVVDAQQRDTYHAVGCRGAYRSTDAGATWQITRKGLPKQLCARNGRRPALTADPQDPRRLYIGTGRDGVFASSDGGATFSAMNRGLENASVVSLLIDPTDSSKLYAGVAQQGVFQWNAELRRWTPLNRGLPLELFAGAVTLDPRQPSILYAASPVKGVFRLDLAGSD